MRIYAHIAIAALLVAGAACLGCRGSRLAGLVDAEGVVTLNGSPVEGATVIFAPKTFGEKSASATAVTDATGKFKLTTSAPGDGAYPGDYMISVSKDRTEGIMSFEESKRRAADPDGAGKEPVPEQSVVHELPVKYGDINSSGLAVTIPEGGDKNITLALEGEVDLTPHKINATRGSGPGL